MVIGWSPDRDDHHDQHQMFVTMLSIHDEQYHQVEWEMRAPTMVGPRQRVLGYRDTLFVSFWISLIDSTLKFMLINMTILIDISLLNGCHQITIYRQDLPVSNDGSIQKGQKHIKCTHYQ
jgi:hypothetical protein